MAMRRVMAAWLACAFGGFLPSLADDPPAGSERQASEVSPARRIESPPGRGRSPDRDAEVRPPWARSIDGTGNNLDSDTMGAAVTALSRMMGADYADGMASLAGAARPGAREVSNAVCAQTAPRPNLQSASDYLWQWGQFLDHDIDLTDGADPPEPADIPVPAGDPFFDPASTGLAVIPFNRSLHDPSTGTDPTNPRQQMNEITAWIDASNVYGSDDVRAEALRTLDGTGRLATSPGNLLPFNTVGLPNAGGPSPDLFLAGDVRANEQSGLTAMHTLFVREHNRLAEAIAASDPSLDGDTIYEWARRIVGAQMQVITYREYLPLLLGPDALAPYEGYKSWVDAGIANEFSTAAYRFGHSALNTTLLRLDVAGEPMPEGHLALRQAFFAPQRIVTGGIDSLLRGLAGQYCQAIDPLIVDDVRNFLFGPPGAGGFDLASLNIKRGRDHGLPGYNATRVAFGLGAVTSFAEISSDPELQARLASVYESPDDLDLWVGGLAEDPVPGAMVGPLVRAVLVRQFEALRDGDRFWYEHSLPPELIAEVEATRLSDIIRRNTGIGDELRDDVFRIRATRSVSVEPGTLSWQPDPWATRYDIVRGDIRTLFETGGDFALATEGCTLVHGSIDTVLDPWIPAPGEGLWYLVRAVSGAGETGTYESGFVNQVGFRDGEIRASGRDCPTP